MKTVMICKCALVAVVLLLAFGAGSVKAELIAYDQFADYADGQLAGQGRGFGWGTNNWTGNTNHTVLRAGNLNYGGLETYGGGVSSGTSAVLGWWQIGRKLATPITNSGTYYLGFLLKPSKSGTSWATHAGIRMDSNNADNFMLGGGIWDNNGDWRLYRKNGGGPNLNIGTVSTGINKTENITHFVIKFEFDPDVNNNTGYVYVNPTDAAALTNSVGNASYTFTAQVPDITKIAVVRWVNGTQIGNMAFDEIRVGTAPEDMFDPIYRPPAGTLFTFQ